MAPGNNPQLVIAVNVQDPRKGGYFGDVVAGPGLLPGGAGRTGHAADPAGRGHSRQGTPERAVIGGTLTPWRSVPPTRSRGRCRLSARCWASGWPPPEVRSSPDELGFITGITLDSRSVRPGDLYVALPGARVHGAAFCADAVAAGAVAVLTDPDGRARAAASGVPVFVLADPRARLGEIACWVYGNPSSRLRLIGVTGTSGKTTSTYLLESGLRAAGHLTGLIGGVETRIGGGAAAQLADHARGARPAGAVRGHGRARGHRRGDGGVESLAGPGPGGGHQLRRGGLH